MFQTLNYEENKSSFLRFFLYILEGPFGGPFEGPYRGPFEGPYGGPFGGVHILLTPLVYEVR